MIDDVRYSELLFLRALCNGPMNFSINNHSKNAQFGLPTDMLAEMVAALIEDLCVRFDDCHQPLVGKLRGEIAHDHSTPSGITLYEWRNPREAILNTLFITNNTTPLRITYRGRRRIEELREELRRDRILEPFGVLLSLQYFRKDLKDALDRGPDVPVCVLYVDMDDFGKINKKFGQDAGDVVMKDYLEVMRDTLGLLGTGYRGLGDETVGLIVGQEQRKALELAEAIRKNVELRQCEHKGIKLPKVTTSIGLASAPPEARGMDLESLADQRKLQAKNHGKNQVVGK